MQFADNKPKSIGKQLRRRIAKANFGVGDDGRLDIATTADIIPFPPSRKFIEDELMMVPDVSVAYKWLQCVVRGRRKRLAELGVSRERIAADIAALESAFGLMPDNATR
jgi:hypothetical protein